MGTEIQISESKESQMMAVLERVALDPNCDVAKMQAVLDVQERMFNKNAEIAFNKSMVECQSEMPTVIRDRRNDQTNSNYAAFETILHTIKPCYTKHGFSLSFGTESSPVERHVRVTCTTMHKDGHTRKDFVDLPLDNVGIKGNANKTEIHGTGSTYSYGKRYLVTMIFNIAIANHDDDAVKAGGVTIESLLQHIAWVRDNFDHVSDLKEALANDEYGKAKYVWSLMSEADMSEFWRAPSKGGILTTDERKKMQSNEWTNADVEVQ